MPLLRKPGHHRRETLAAEQKVVRPSVITGATSTYVAVHSPQGQAGLVANSVQGGVRSQSPGGNDQAD